MTSIDRTIYRRMKRSYTTKELIEAYTPTEEERSFVSTMTRTVQNQLNLMLWIKLFPCLGYVANALMLQNVADLTEALAQLKQRGYPVQEEDVAHLSVYMTEHLQRFGEYTLKLRPAAPLSTQEKVSPDVPSEQSVDAEELSA